MVGDRHGHELPIVPVKCLQRWFIRELSELAVIVRGDWDAAADARIPLPFIHPFHESIPGSRLPGKAQVSGILREDQAGVIENEMPGPSHSEQGLDTRLNAFERGAVRVWVRLRGVIGNNSDVCVDDYERHYSAVSGRVLAIAIRRSKLIFACAAISSI